MGKGASAGFGLRGFVSRARRGASAIGADGDSIGISAPPARGLTSRIAARQIARSFWSGRRPAMVRCGFAVADEDDVETTRAMRTEFDALLDIARPRRSRDEVDGAWHFPASVRLAPLLTKTRPAILICGNDLIAAHDDDMCV